MTVDNPIETETPAPHAVTTDQNSPTQAEISLEVLSRLEQAAAAPTPSVSNTPPRKTYPTRNHTKVQKYEPTL